MDYPSLKILHMSLAAVTVSGFVLRWYWLKLNSPLSVHRLTRILPHVIDTLFLASAIWLSITIHQYPFSHAWLTAKMLGLIAYIMLGSLALKRAPTPALKDLAFIAALLVFAWVTSVARTKSLPGF